MSDHPTHVAIRSQYPSQHEVWPRFGDPWSFVCWTVPDSGCKILHCSSESNISHGGRESSDTKMDECPAFVVFCWKIFEMAFKLSDSPCSAVLSVFIISVTRGAQCT